jgi:hypothetical protein
MKIGIWGDSYATRVDWIPDQRLGNSWVDWLRDWGYDLDLHAYHGTSLWYSYRSWQQLHEQYDKVIFLATAYHRVSIRGLDLISTVSPEHLDWHQDQTRDPIIKRALAAARDYVIWAQDLDYYWHMQLLIIAEIQRRSPHCLIIPCFKGLDEHLHFRTDNTHHTEGWPGPCLHEITRLDQNYFGLNDRKIDLYWDLRHCHINERNNLELAAIIRQWLDRGRIDPFNSSRFHTPGLELSDYFRRKT